MDKVVAFSGCGCVIRADEVPVAGGATLEEALTSGEEAALVCAGPEALVLQAGLRPVGLLTPGESLHGLGARGQPGHRRENRHRHLACPTDPPRPRAAGRPRRALARPAEP